MSEGRGVDGSYGLGSASKPRQVHLTISRIQCPPEHRRSESRDPTWLHICKHWSHNTEVARRMDFSAVALPKTCAFDTELSAPPKLGERLAFQVSSKLLSPLALRLPSLMPLRPWTPGFWHFAGRERSTGNRNACSKFGIRARISMLSRISCNQPRM